MYKTGNHDKEDSQGKGEDEEDDLSYLDRPMITYSQHTIPKQPTGIMVCCEATWEGNPNDRFPCVPGCVPPACVLAFTAQRTCQNLSFRQITRSVCCV